MKSFNVEGLEIGKDKFTFIGGTCLAESNDICCETAETIKEICKDLGFNYIYKSSFDKAGRSSVKTARGESIQNSLDILRNIKKKYEVPVTTDIHLPEHAEMIADFVGLIQIPAFLSRQTDLLEAAAKTGRPVNVKKGQFMAPADAWNVIEKLEAFDAAGIMITERGISFGYNKLIVDMPGLEIMRKFGHPVCFDSTHSAQLPGLHGPYTGGAKETIPALARAAMAVGVDAMFMEVHPNPEKALSDGTTQWPLHKLRDLLEQVAAIRETTLKFQKELLPL